jgi:hypothetical protein
MFRRWLSFWSEYEWSARPWTGHIHEYSAVTESKGKTFLLIRFIDSFSILNRESRGAICITNSRLATVFESSRQNIAKILMRMYLIYSHVSAGTVAGIIDFRRDFSGDSQISHQSYRRWAQLLRWPWGAKSSDRSICIRFKAIFPETCSYHLTLYFKSKSSVMPQLSQ